jgi:hypothetical protein
MRPRPALSASWKEVCGTVVFGSCFFTKRSTVRMSAACSAGKNSVMRTVTTVSTLVLGSTAGRRSANRSLITSTRAPASENWWIISGAV